MSHPDATHGPESQFGASPFMRRALDLARGVVGTTSPNPAVGAVLVRDGRIVGEGATAPPGGVHAEVAAIRAAGPAARDATIYVTLEPCSIHGRTPPCTDAILVAGIAEVVAAFGDPDPRVDGTGLEHLREAGLTVRSGDGALAAAEHYRAYAHHRRSGRPFVIAKYAASLDGKIAATSGDARWVSGPEARAWSHRLRRRHDAILVGVGTVLADDPQLTARTDDGADQDHQSLRVVLDSHGRTPPGARLLLDQDLAPTVIACTKAAPAAWRAQIASAGARVQEFPAADGRVALEPLLDWLAGEGIVSLVVEGGGGVHGAFFDQRLVQRVYAVIAPIVIGGGALSAVGGTGARRMTDAVRLRDVQVDRLGGDLLVTGSPVPPPPNESASLRPAAPADAGAIAALIDDSALRADLLPAIATALDEAGRAQGGAWVAVSSGCVVGGLAAGYDGFGGSDGRAHLQHLLVAAPWRDHDLADRLLDSAEGAAAGRGCRWAVSTLCPETEAQGFTREHWARRGYRYYRRDGDGATLLIKEIATREQVTGPG